MNYRDKLATAVTTYDRKQFGKRSYNVWALGQYLERVAGVAADIDRGADPRAAILAGFSGALCNACLRGVCLPIATAAEQCGTGFAYRPITEGPENDD